jgi:uncharacterized protein YchJ
MLPVSSETSQNLTDVQSRVLQALAKGATMTAAAAACNLHRSTLYLWIKSQPEFNAGVREARTECYRDLCELRQEMHDLAWSTLRSLLADPNTPASVRLRAALAVLNNGFKSPELDEASTVESVESVESPAVSKTTAVPKKFVESVENVESAKRTHEIPRNAPCPCGSGIKFKRCCGRGTPPRLHPSNRMTAPPYPAWLAKLEKFVTSPPPAV